MSTALVTPDDKPGKSKRRLLAKLGDPMAWSNADKCLLVAAIMLPATAVFACIHRFLGGWLYLQAGVDSGLHNLVYLVAGSAAAGWMAVIGVGLIARRLAPNALLPVYLAILLYALGTGMFVYLSGPFHSPGWVAVIGGAVVGLLLFGRTVTLIGLLAFVMVFACFVLVGEYGWLGDLPLATRVPPAGAPERVWWMARMGVTTTLFAAFTISLAAFIVSLWRDRERRLEVISKTDALTGVFNRRHFMETLSSEFLRARRYDTPMSCIMVDLDHFKRINDQHGHLIGDRVLHAVAQALAGLVRDTDIVARYGGEEFVILLPNTGRQGACELAERCRSVLASVRVEHGSGVLSVTGSMGVSTFPDNPAETVEEMLGHADSALYEAKAAGRNVVIVASA